MKLREALGLAPKHEESVMSKLSSEEQTGLMKRAGEIIQENLDVMQYTEDLQKVAAEQIEAMDFSNPELQKIAGELYNYGVGLADGEFYARQALVPAIYEEVYGNIMNKIAEVVGPEVAENLDGALRDAGGEAQAGMDEIEALHGELTENIASALAEQAGGVDAVTQDPELSAQILEQASQAAGQVIEENLAPQE